MMPMLLTISISTTVFCSSLTPIRGKREEHVYITVQIQQVFWYLTALYRQGGDTAETQQFSIWQQPCCREINVGCVKVGCAEVRHKGVEHYP